MNRRSFLKAAAVGLLAAGLPPAPAAVPESSPSPVPGQDLTAAFSWQLLDPGATSVDVAIDFRSDREVAATFLPHAGPPTLSPGDSFVRVPMLPVGWTEDLPFAAQRCLEADIQQLCGRVLVEAAEKNAASRGLCGRRKQLEKVLVERLGVPARYFVVGDSLLAVPSEPIIPLQLIGFISQPAAIERTPSGRFRASCSFAVVVCDSVYVVGGKLLPETQA